MIYKHGACTQLKQLLVVGIVFFSLSFWYMPAHDPDLGWHLLGGDYIIRHGTVPFLDPINAFNKYWIDYHWLAQVFLSWTYNLFGLDGLRVLLGIIWGLLGIELIRLIRAASSNKLTIVAEAAIFFWAARLLGQVTSIRPQVFAFLLLVMALRIIITKDAKYKLTRLFVLATILTNVHVYWIFIPILWAIFAFSDRLRKSPNLRPVQVYGGFTLLILAGFISPYGIFARADAPFGIFTNHAVLLEYAHTAGALRDSISELQGSLVLPGIVPWLFIAAVGLALYARFNIRPGYSMFYVSIALVGLFLAVQTLKFMALFAIFSIPLLAKSLLRIEPIIARTHPKRIITEKIVIVSFVLFSILSALIYSPLFTDREEYQDELPIKACAKIQDFISKPNTSRDTVRILTHFDYGGWCRFAAYERDPEYPLRVTTDGRTQFVPYRLLERSFNLYRLHFDWAETLAQWAPDIILVEKNRALGQFLGRARLFWTKVYEDSKFALFVPARKGEHNKN